MMPAPVEFFDNIKGLLRDELDRKLQDKYLDLWLRAELLATEWDAIEWGFDPLYWVDTSDWSRQEREQLAKFNNKPTGRR